MPDLPPRFENEHLLDNPIWTSLTTTHAHLAIGANTGHGLARRYPAAVGPLSAFEKPAAEAYADLPQSSPKATSPLSSSTRNQTLPKAGSSSATAHSSK